MKNRLVLIALIFIVKLATAQTLPPDSPAYKRFPTVPPINILQVDSTPLTKDKLKHQPTIIMYFSPECDHCKHQTKDIIESIDKLKNIEIVMATYFPFGEMKEFYKNFHIEDHPNIKLGRDEKYGIPTHYSMHSLPFLALYDKKGNLVTTFEGNQKIATILDAFKKNN